MVSRQEWHQASAQRGALPQTGGCQLQQVDGGAVHKEANPALLTGSWKRPHGVTQGKINIKRTFEGLNKLIIFPEPSPHNEGTI